MVPDMMPLALPKACAVAPTDADPFYLSLAIKYRAAPRSLPLRCCPSVPKVPPYPGAVPGRLWLTAGPLLRVSTCSSALHLPLHSYPTSQCPNLCQEAEHGGGGGADRPRASCKFTLGYQERPCAFPSRCEPCAASC